MSPRLRDRASPPRQTRSDARENRAALVAAAETLVAEGGRHYLACWPDDDLLEAVVDHLAAAAGLDAKPLPGDLRLRRRGTLQFAFNYGAEAVDVPAPDGADFRLGQRRLAGHDVAAWTLP